METALLNVVLPDPLLSVNAPVAAIVLPEIVILPNVVPPNVVTLPKITLEYAVVTMLPVVVPSSVVLVNTKAAALSFQPIKRFPPEPRINTEPKS